MGQETSSSRSYAALDPVSFDLGERLRSELAEVPYRRLFVGFSGGLDSTVLLHIGQILEADVRAVHVNHGLHPQAGDWERHCADFCRRLHIAFLTRRAQARGGSEADAREARYSVFEDVLDVDDLLLLGHHRDDQAETVLLRLVQGRAPLGMPRTRRLQCGAHILRPWLATPKKDLLQYAHRAGLDWIEDVTNTQVDFDRNFLRQEILPRLASRWPGVAGALAAGAETQLARDALLTYLADIDATVADSADAVGGELPTGVGANGARDLALAQFPQQLRVAVLRLWLHGLGEFSVSDRALSEFIRQLAAPKDAHPRLRLHQGMLMRHGAKVHYIRPDFELRSSYRLELPGVLELPHGELVAEAHSAGFHATGALTVKFRRGGERLRRGGETRSVRKLLHGAGIPAWRRYSWPLVYSGSELLAIPGVANADSPDREPRWRVFWRPGSN